jgi:hypothetical protein
MELVQSFGQYRAFEFGKIGLLPHTRTFVPEVQQVQHHPFTLQDQRGDFAQQLQALERISQSCQDGRTFTFVNEVKSHVRKRQ